MPGMNMPCIWVVEDNEIFRSVLMAQLESRQFRVRGFPDLQEVLASLGGPLPATIVADVLMEGGGGLELIDRLTAVDLKIPVVLMSGSDDPELHRRALGQGAVAFLRKPFDLKDLLGVLEHVRSGTPSQGLLPS